MTALPNDINRERGETVPNQPRRRRGGRLSFGVLLSILGVGLCAASIAWACAPGNYGWTEPQAPASEASPPSQGGGSPSATPPSSAPAPAAPQPETGTVNSPNAAPVKSPNAAPVKSPGQVPTQRPARRPVAPSPGATAPPTDTPSDISEAATGNGSPSDEGAGAGSMVQQLQSPQSGAGARAGGRSAAPAGSPAESPSSQAATGDLWSAFEADGAASLTPSSGAVAADTGPGTGFSAGLALLGLGAAALLGSLAFAQARRRRSMASGGQR